MEYRHNGEPLRWAALFEPGVIDLFGSDDEFRAAGYERDVGPVVEQAMEIVGRSRAGGLGVQQSELSDQDAAELKVKLKAQAARDGVPYASFEHFVRATKEGADDGGPLLGSGWVYEFPFLQGNNEPISSGCRTFGPALIKRVSSVCLTGGLILFQEPSCRTLAGQVPLTLTSAVPRIVNDLGVWNRLASSAYTWG